ALRDLRLVGGIGGEEFASRDQRVDNHRAIVKVRSSPEEAGVAVAILAGALAKKVHDLGLRHLAWNIQVTGKPVFGGNGRKQVVDRTQADGLKHGFAV